MVLSRYTVLSDRYVIDDVLGRKGPLDITYRAHRLIDEASVVIREYYPQALVRRTGADVGLEARTPADEPTVQYGRECYLREALLLSQLDHRNVAPVLEHFRENGTVYVVRAQHRGSSLASFLKQAGGQVPPPMALAILYPLLDGLEAGHQGNLIHGLLSPDHIHLGEEGLPLLLSFYTARLLVARRTGQLGEIIDPAYAPPEAVGLDGKLGAWTDVYGAAAVLYTMLTGQTLPSARARLEHDSIATHLQHAAVPPALRDVLAAALALDADERPISVHAFREALRAAFKLASPRHPTAAAPSPSDDEAHVATDDAIEESEDEVSLAAASTEDAEEVEPDSRPYAITAAFADPQQSLDEHEIVISDETLLAQPADTPATKDNAEDAGTWEPLLMEVEPGDLEPDEREPDDLDPVALEEPAPPRPTTQLSTSEPTLALQTAAGGGALNRPPAPPARTETPWFKSPLILGVGGVALAILLAALLLWPGDDPASFDAAGDEGSLLDNRALDTYARAVRRGDSLRQEARLTAIQGDTAEARALLTQAIATYTLAAQDLTDDPLTEQRIESTTDELLDLRAPSTIAAMPSATPTDSFGQPILTEDVSASGGDDPALDGLTSLAPSYETYRAQGDSLVAVGEFTEARRMYDLALAYRPDDPYVQERLRATQVELDRIARRVELRRLLRVGNEQLAAGDLAEARRSFARGLELDPSNDDFQARLDSLDGLLAEAAAREQRFQYLRGQADARYEEGNFTAALAQYQEALDLRPDDAYVAGRIADIRRASGSRDSYATLRARADQLFVRGDAEGALTAYEAVLATRPDDVEAQERVAALRLEIDDRDRAQRTDAAGYFVQPDRHPILIDPEGVYSQAVYPDQARTNGIEGRVILRLLVSRAGKVIDVEIVDGPRFGLRAEAERVARLATFQPALFRGEPVDAWTAFSIQFQFDE